jgi:hypothetical protein
MKSVWNQKLISSLLKVFRTTQEGCRIFAEKMDFNLDVGLFGFGIGRQ